MKNSQLLLSGLIIALASIVLILGGISLSVTEGIIPANLTSTQTPTPTNSPIWQPFTPSVYSPTPPPVLILSLTPTWTPTLPPPPTNCPMPLGWWPYVVKSGDTLDYVARYYQISVVELQQVNCLLTSELLPGTLIYVPSVPTFPTQTPLPCGRPSGWIVYFVQPGDTLYHLSQAYGIGIADLQRANCMDNSTTLHVGQTLYVPPWAPRILSPTFPQALTPTPTQTPTPTVTPTPMPTNTTVIVPPHTAVPTDTPLFEPTDTDVLETTDTPLPTRTPVPTHTPEPPATETFTPTCEC